MFAGSMFEHSCEPNCFAGTWQQKAKHPRLYRALRDIEVGEPLSISYFQLPELYLPTVDRARILASWNFVCTCPRCTSLPEVTRAFLCPACSAPELCPPLPGVDVVELRCLKCGVSAEASYVARCFELEDVLRRLAEGEEEAAPSRVDGDQNNDLISCFHNAAFQAAWRNFQDMSTGSGTRDEAAELTADLIQCITRFADNARHPLLLELYHTMAQLEAGNLEAQQHYLELEHAAMKWYYPEEAEKQDLEIWHLMTRAGPQMGRPPASDTDLSGMD